MYPKWGLPLRLPQSAFFGLKRPPAGAIRQGAFSCLFFEVFKISLHPVCGIALHVFRRVSISRECKARGCMAQQALNRFQVCPGCQSNGRGGVPEVMGPQVWPPDGFSNSLESSVESDGLEVLSVGIGKDEMPRIFPSLPELQSFQVVFCLPGLFSLEVGQSDLRTINNAAASILRAVLKQIL